MTAPSGAREEAMRFLLQTGADAGVKLIATRPEGDNERLLGQAWPFPSPFQVTVRTVALSEGLDRIEARARRSLERMGLPLGPVCATPTGRAQFFVAPGAAAELPQLLYRMGWDDADLDLEGLGIGTHITAPPSDLGGLGPVRWLRPPTLDTAGAPPQARLLLGTLAYICHRSHS